MSGLFCFYRSPLVITLNEEKGEEKGLKKLAK